MNEIDDNLVTWITEEIEKRRWSIRELGRKSDISHATISNVLSGQNKPTFEFCSGIAKAFHVSPEMLMRKAGLFPPLPEDKKTEEELLWYFRALPSDVQRLIVAQARVAYEIKREE